MVSQEKAETMEAMQAALRRLLDEEAIKKVHLRYCRGIDRRDWELLRSCYHPDALDDHGDYVGGVDGFIKFCSGVLFDKARCLLDAVELRFVDLFF